MFFLLRQHKQNSKNGFTLVEVIVVLVILALLAAIAIPSLTGYIDKAKDKALITQCRHAVMAAQTIATEEYAINSSLTGSFTGAMRTAAQTLSEMSGTIKEVNYNRTATITKLLYTAKDGISVLYENGVYTVMGKSGGNANDLFLGSFEKYVNKFKDGTLIAKDYATADCEYPNQLQAARLAYLKEHGSYTALSDSEKNLIRDLNKNQEYKGSDAWTWVPCYSTTGEHFMFAGNQTDSASGLEKWGTLVYYDGSYYAWQKGNSTLDAKWISDAGKFNIDDLKNPPSGYNSGWVKTKLK